MGRVARFFRLEKAEKWLLGKVSLFSIADAVDIITVFTSFGVGCVVGVVGVVWRVRLRLV